MRFIDLYAGLGCFHQALSKLGHKCVWATEINPTLRELYKKNFPGTLIEGDIFKKKPDEIPVHDIICAGFPCQPFSKAGKRKGLKDIKNGNHFHRILQIIDSKKKSPPKYLLLENVAAILSHDNGYTFKLIKKELKKRNYDVSEKILSPHEFGVPHYRRRLFIVGAHKDTGGLKTFKFPQATEDKNLSIDKIIDINSQPLKGENVYLTNYQKEVISFWEGFLKMFSKNDIPSFPIWSQEWGANYPFIDTTPHATPASKLKGLKGSFGKKIISNQKKEIFLNTLPRYSTTKQDKFPSWKIRFIKKNREFYLNNKTSIDGFLKKNRNFFDFEFSHQKFEWNCKGEENILYDKLIQFRPSGIRVKKKNWAPALTTVRTQNIFYPKLGRQLSVLENARLQSLELNFLPDIKKGKFHANGGYKALGNAVNVRVVKLIAKNLLN